MRGVRPNVDAHEVTTDRPSSSLTPAPPARPARALRSSIDLDLDLVGDTGVGVVGLGDGGWGGLRTGRRFRLSHPRHDRGHRPRRDRGRCRARVADARTPSARRGNSRPGSGSFAFRGHDRAPAGGAFLLDGRAVADVAGSSSSAGGTGRASRRARSTRSAAAPSSRAASLARPGLPVGSPGIRCGARNRSGVVAGRRWCLRRRGGGGSWSVRAAVLGRRGPGAGIRHGEDPFPNCS
jgi:hypothetical protein